ncbi:MAG: AAA family ATPase [Fimbriimonadaceae bacterium]|nr:AAA family ATPase [Fimbriimonadaceae bacterium]
MTPDTPNDASNVSQLLDRIVAASPPDNVRLQNYVNALRNELETDARRQQQLREQLAEYEAAYEKLTAPANRIGTFLDWLDLDASLALISAGDTEYAAKVDDKLDKTQLFRGASIRVNEAFAIIGVINPPSRGAIVKVAQVLEDGRLRLGSDTPGSDSRVAFRGAALEETKITAGDEVRLDRTGTFAVEHFGRQESQDYFLEAIPELPWEKVGGQQEAIRIVRETIEQPLLHPEIFRAYDQKPIKGMLLYGPPGNGKTLIGKAIAYNLTQEYSKQQGREVKEYFMAISGPKILNMWLGETERMVREIFRTAREKAKEGRLVFIFMDEAEAVLRTRSTGRYLNISNTVVPQFCAELDGLQSLDNVILMLTSNRPDYIDPAVLRPGRIDRKVKINRPDRASAEQILAIYLTANLPYDPELIAQWNGEVDCVRKALVEQTIEMVWRTDPASEFLRVDYRNANTETLYRKDLVSGALLKGIVDRAKESAIRRAIGAPGQPHGIQLDDLLAAVDAEYRENEIFPKSDALDDWLQLLDVSPENVVAVKPVHAAKRRELGNRRIE